ncbi:unnamed protein product [Ranitomeya imitator]|uniref:Uncharacterized protein n=1 Tax=Ranitomeya imitator TaxID=111125 RepID=A0ABN9MSP3_9NEOB|nr:unnamed protein product [Ranitomeya imitator]
MSWELEQNLRLETGERERDSLETRSLAQQNVELRRRLEEEQAAYKRKLQAYQEGQQRQGAARTEASGQGPAVQKTVRRGGTAASRTFHRVGAGTSERESDRTRQSETRSRALCNMKAAAEYPALLAASDGRRNAS